MKIKVVALFFSLILSALGQDADKERQNEDKADREKASALFKSFQTSLYTDSKKANQVFGEFLKMPAPIQDTLQKWLDKEWTAKRQSYQNATKRAGGTKSKKRGPDRQVLKEHRQVLDEIRKIESEDKMKKELKSKGWTALEKLLKEVKKGGGSKASASPADNAALADLLKDALAVGEFRHKLYSKRGLPSPEPKTELGLAGKEDVEEEAEKEMELSSKHRSIFEENEKLKGEIPINEYKGIVELNEWRVASGFNPLLIDPKLCAASRDHSKDMAKNNFFSHTSPVKGKEHFLDRAKNFNTTARGENIAINSSYPQANQAWFFSPGHHKNMFQEKYTYIGLGISGRHYTQLFR